MRPKEGAAPSATQVRAQAFAEERAGRIWRAIAILKDAVERGPDDWTNLRLLADLLTRAGQWKVANEHYRRLAQNCELDQLHTQAIAVWKRILQNEPESSSAHLKLGELYGAAGLRAEARKHYGAALVQYRKGGRTREVAQVEARLARLDDGWAPAAAPPLSLEQAAGRDEAPPPADAEFVKESLVQSRLFRRYGLHVQARARLDAVLARFPDHLEARRELYDLVREVGPPQEAREQRRLLEALRKVGVEVPPLPPEAPLPREQPIPATTDAGGVGEAEAGARDRVAGARATAADRVGEAEAGATTGREAAATAGGGAEGAAGAGPEVVAAKAAALAAGADGGGAASAGAEAAASAAAEAEAGGETAAEATRTAGALVAGLTEAGAGSGADADAGTRIGAAAAAQAPTGIEAEATGSAVDGATTHGAGAPAAAEPPARAEAGHHQLGRDDYETRYNLGVAYREMGLLDEAIVELQLAAAAPARLAECASMLAECYLEMEEPPRAVRWLEKGLTAPGLTAAQVRTLRYHLADACEKAGEASRALGIYAELRDEDEGFRDVAEKVRRLSGAAGTTGPDAAGR